MSRVAAFLHCHSTGHQAQLPPEVEWVDVDVAAVAGDLTDRPFNLARLARVGASLAHGPGAAIRGQLDEFCARGGRVVMCADDGALAVAVACRYLWGRPVAPVRFVTGELTPQSGRFGAWFRNRGCLVNIAAGPQVRRALLDYRMGRHRLLSVASPSDEDPGSLRTFLREAVDTIGGAPHGDEHLTLAYVTHFYFNQANSDTATAMLERFASYAPELLDRVHFVIVDDGSPIDYEIPRFDLNLTWIKIEQDIRWNQPGARNVGMVYARADNVFLTDIDIEVPEHTLAYFARRGPCGAWMYRPARRDRITGAPDGRHPNCFLLSRARFLRNFGYDEEFSGNYAFDDLRFVKNQKVHGTVLARLPSKYFVLARTEIDLEKSYHNLSRDFSANAMLNARKHFEVDWYGRHGGHSRKNLGFTWKILCDRRRSRPAPAIDRLYKPTWYLRQLWPR